jgi:transposase-like protein
MSIITLFPTPSKCSRCGGKLHKHGKRKRHVIEACKKVWYQVQRFLCTNCESGKTFTLLLPNMLPHKHYTAYEIEQVLQNQEDPTTSLHSCGAEESTLRRWKQEFPQKLSALAASLESLVNVSITRLVPPLQRVYNALSLLVHPPPNQSRLAWAYFMS